MNRFTRTAATGGQNSPRSRAWLLRQVAAVVGFALIPGLLTPVAFAADADPLGRPDLKAPRADKVSRFTPQENKKAAAAMEKAAAAGRADSARAKREQADRNVTWPKAGTATINAPATGTAKAEPGGLPLTLMPAKSARGVKPPRAANSVKATVLDQAQAAKLGVKGVVLSVTGPATGGNAQLGIDYKAFASAYGGDWAGRLQVLRLPDCALKDAASAKCRTRTPLEFTNRRRQSRIDAQLTFASAPTPQATSVASGQTMVLALAAGTKSGSGDYKATPLAASSTWEAGGSSGTFTWSYPLRTPPAAAGPKPDVKISYDSGSVDGRTASTNNQGTVIGEGFEITSSYIERKYGSCDDDGQTDKFDLCWKYENASLVLNGKATELVKDDTSGQWRLKNDDASTVIHRSDANGADNGDDNKEYWTVITGEGTKYHFGLNKLPGSTTQATQSVWTVPVFGDDAGEPGYSQSGSFAGRAEKQAWRWNLDYVEDTHGNASSYWYAAESNHYDMLGDDTTGTQYVRGGILQEIRYGQRKDTLFASPAGSNRVLFDYAERCVASGTGCDSLTEDTRDNWPDVPFDAECKADLKCTGNVGPSFYTRKRMTGITTQAWDAAAATPAYVPVDSWALKQTYLDPGDTGDSTDQSLWLSEIRHTGRRGTAIILPPVTFGHEYRPNRVDGASDNILPLNKPRLYTITSEAGAQTIVNYMQADCLAGQAKPRVDTNTRRCYPVYWSPNGGKEPTLDWFHKYPVSSVSSSDQVGAALPVQHTYTYAGGGAWHYNDDPMTKEKERTWSVWRGFEKVTHVTGAADKTQSRTVSVFMRGMNGDRVLGPDGKTPDADQRKGVTVTGIKASELTDSEQYAGFTRESVTYNGAQEVSGTVNDPWSKRTATQHKSYADTEAHFVRTGATHARTNVTSTGTPKDRVRTTETLYDAYGMAYQVVDQGDDELTNDQRCTRTWYARNDAVGINSLVSRTRTTSGLCVPDALLDLPVDYTSPGDVISDTATAYDSTTWSASQEPTVGEARWTGRAKGYGIDDQPAWQKTATISYDTLGRPLTVKDTNDTTVTTSTYTPSAVGPLTSTTAANAKGHTTTTLVDFATGAAKKVTDSNGKITESEYDAMGRVTKVWLPNRSKSLGKTPNYVYAYSLTTSALPWVSSGTLKGDGSGYNTAYEIYDSLLRPRQVQAPSPAGGMTVAETFYDERGLAVTAQSDIWANNTAPSGTLVETDGAQAPTQADTTYDGAGRVIKTITKTRNVPRWTTETTYSGDTVATSAPAGGQATAVVTNALGEATERREYAGPQPTGTGFTATSFTYTAAGQQLTITGPDQAKWSYSYDLFGRQTSATDPDKGTGTTTYNELDQVVSTTDARAKTLLSEYDMLGRKTGVWDGTRTDATKLAAWTFDTLAKGQQDTAVRYENGVNQANSKAYTQKVTSYNSLYQATGNQLTLPDSDPLVVSGVPKALAFSVGYNLDGTVMQVGSPAVAGLPSEVVAYTNNDLGQQLTANGATGYLQGALYSPPGDLRQLTLATNNVSTTKKAYLNYDYEDGSRRLTRSYVTDDVHGYMPQELKFAQDEAGNVNSIFDATTQGGTSKADYQCFAYDGHRRLTEAWTPKTADCDTSGRTTANLDGAAPYWTSYTYTAGGQRKTETQHATSGNATTTHEYGTALGQPHAVSNTTGAKASTYAYDKAGNTTSRPGTQAQQTLTWNTEGKLVGTTEPAAGAKPATGTSYLYDAHGELLIRRTTTGDGDTVLYLGGNEVRLTTKGTTKTLSGTRYYSAAGQTIAVRTATVGTTGTKLNFLAGDHHGTSSLAIDATTLAVTKRYTTPFGAPRGTNPTAWPDDKAFLGKPADTTTGLTHIGAREYDPGIGQFISVDPLLSVDQHQSLNGYNYANNTPVTSADPTGLRSDGDTPCGGVGRCPGAGQPGSDNCYAGNMSASCDGIGGNNMGTGGTGGTASGGGGSGGGGGGGGGNTGGGWWSDFTSTFVDEAKNLGNGFVDQIGNTLSNTWNCVTLDGTCSEMAQGFYAATPNGMATAAANGLAARGNEIYTDFDNGRSAQGSAKIAFDVALAAATRGVAGKIGGSKIPPGCKCFLAGTGVLMANGQVKDIEDIELGDKVLATDPETGEAGPREVTRLIVTEADKHFNKLSIATKDGLETLTATHEHPFWSPSEHAWVEARDLEPGMTLLTDHGNTVIVTANHAFAKHARTYNLTVDDLHTYYVLAGATPVLVHNSGCGTAGPYTLSRTEGLSGNASIKNVDKLAKDMKENGWQGDPIEVFEHGGSRYVINGHHRVAAAKRAGIEVPYTNISLERLQGYGYKSADDVVAAWANVRPDSLTNKYKRR
ncbi:polymorphic toxin-type HINT domain-containing protein [Streptomyces sp. NPDC019443]|uniref:polymorphic toxin-type HINT domain-containing protein n=1 Tax=Streptomyces sp. NPDC019443 TaxID=3365061 RepID=UPI0037B88237